MGAEPKRSVSTNPDAKPNELLQPGPVPKKLWSPRTLGARAERALLVLHRWATIGALVEFVVETRDLLQIFSGFLEDLI